MISLEGKAAGSIRCADEGDDGGSNEVNLISSTAVNRKLNKDLAKVYSRQGAIGRSLC